ncbi:hypothetical protein RR46_02765 [Papilio xuthus]|uniref:Uncharacterized protein n=1 Tax=Papilio xuthus TaxID=66420 RepID=A0A194Q4A7_PAPXU|nr:hypothetical protein RR46_02765 [Papilio xuthus]
MFGLRTPDRKADRAAASNANRVVSPRSGSSPEITSNVRRSIGDWELGRAETKESSARIRTPEKTKMPTKRIVFTKEPRPRDWKEKHKKDFKNKETNLPCWRIEAHTTGRGSVPCAAPDEGKRVAVQHLQSKKEKIQTISLSDRQKRGSTWDGARVKKGRIMIGNEDLPIIKDGEASVSGDIYAEDPPPSEDAAEHIKIRENTSETNNRRHDEPCSLRLIRRNLRGPQHPRNEERLLELMAISPRLIRNSPGIGKWTPRIGSPPHLLEGAFVVPVKGKRKRQTREY